MVLTAAADGRTATILAIWTAVALLTGCGSAGSEDVGIGAGADTTTGPSDGDQIGESGGTQYFVLLENGCQLSHFCRCA